MTSTQSASHYEPDAGETPLPGALLVFSEAAPQFRPVALTARAAVILGREDIGGAAVPDQRMSKQHCELSFDGKQFTVKALGKNGTWVNGKKIEGTDRASSGDVLRLAQSIFLLLDDLRPFVAGTVTTSPRVIGPTYRTVLDRIAVGGRGGSTVLITGENGAGKQFAAKTFHQAVASKGPFIEINCATVPATLAERLFFGAVKGVATDIKADAPGYMHAADGGVLFLDEVGELHPNVQAKLLTAVETNDWRKVGRSGSSWARVVRPVPRSTRPSELKSIGASEAVS